MKNVFIHDGRAETGIAGASTFLVNHISDYSKALNKNEALILPPQKGFIICTLDSQEMNMWCVTEMLS